MPVLFTFAFFLHVLFQTFFFSVQNFVVEADDLEQIEELGRGAYGVVDKMKHVPSGVIMAVKVEVQTVSLIFFDFLFVLLK